MSCVTPSGWLWPETVTVTPNLKLGFPEKAWRTGWPWVGSEKHHHVARGISVGRSLIERLAREIVRARVTGQGANPSKELVRALDMHGLRHVHG